MSKQKIRELALDKGFKLKEQPNGEMDLNPYVYHFAEALIKDHSGWISVDDENDYPQLMKVGTLTFWHKVHKCEITGFIVENELEDKIQGQYSVIEQTKTTKWPMESFSFVRAPSLPPTKEA